MTHPTYPSQPYSVYADAVEVSTGDDYKVADLVLLRRAQ